MRYNTYISYKSERHSGKNKHSSNLQLLSALQINSYFYFNGRC
uniref:Uncharacterized protein n=1 Tax=Myoviridae sp. ct5xZ3 TaxID=2827601 RepID=A0A8S5RRQ2_9CAUD|nr:MAG TPA: hypothetical protein [Myoviridae sp. ct5xZ3]